MTNTTTEAVGRLIASATSEPWEVDACNMMAALAQERDAAVARAERWDTEAAAARITIPRIEAERDAARAEVERLRRGWLTTIQTENSCPATGGGCFAKRCGCLAEMEMLLREHDERAALAATEGKQ